jgi:hypothetical protein
MMCKRNGCLFPTPRRRNERAFPTVFTAASTGAIDFPVPTARQKPHGKLRSESHRMRRFRIAAALVAIASGMAIAGLLPQRSDASSPSPSDTTTASAGVPSGKRGKEDGSDATGPQDPRPGRRADAEEPDASQAADNGRGGSAAGSAADSQAADELWMVSTRHLPSRVGCTIDSQMLRIYGLDPRGCRVPAREERLFETFPGTTCLFVHGNQIEAPQARERGLLVYHRIRAANLSAGPLRFVLWSWPSDQLRRPLKDVRVKLARTNVEAFYLASFLRQMPRQHLSLVGYSYGARIVTGALHLDGGGVLLGYGLGDVAASGSGLLRVALLAAAVDTDWLLPGHPHGLALTQVDGLLLLNNTRDRILKRYHVVAGRGATALGRTGLPWLLLPGQDRQLVQQFDLAALMGREHSLRLLLCNPQTAARLARHVRRDP